MNMHLRNATLASAVAAALGLAPQTVLAQDGSSPLKWYGSIYAKFLDGNRRYEEGLYGAVDGVDAEGGGDQGQGLELELMFNAQVSKQVEIGGRIHSRFNKNFWTNYGGFGVPDNNTANGGEDDPRANQYIKLRGAWARITPGYEWMDSATIGNSDWGMFDPWTQGKSRYIDRDNFGGVLLQGSALDRTVRWDVARISIPNYLGIQFDTGGNLDGSGVGFGQGDIYANDANWVGQVKYQPGPDWNMTLIGMYAKDRSIDKEDDYTLDGQSTKTAFDNTVVALKGQYSGLGWMDVSGAFYYSDFNADNPTAGWNFFDNAPCDGKWTGNCTFSPIPSSSMNDTSWLINLNFNELLLDGLSLSVQFFDVGSDYVSVMAARRESDVLLTEGQEATWMWGRPDYITGDRANRPAMKGVGWGGWNGEVQQVVGSADNDFTDFDEPVAYQVTGWKGVTLVPKFIFGDWEFAAEYSYIDFNTNWQACGGDSKDDCGGYYANEGMHAWGYGGDYRSPYAPYQDRLMQIFALRAMYTLDVGNGVDLMARYKYISDEDDRVTKSRFLTDAYPGSSVGASGDWIPNQGLGGCLGCDDRQADYDTYGFSVGYQLHPDLYTKLIYELHKVELIDGTIDVVPLGAQSFMSWANYLTGETTKNRVALDFSYFLSGVEFGGTIDYFWGDYDPSFFTDLDGRRVRLVPGALDTVATALGNISRNGYDYNHYRMKIFMKVSF
jgi:hypothetical protein